MLNNVIIILWIASGCLVGIGACFVANVLFFVDLGWIEALTSNLSIKGYWLMVYGLLGSYIMNRVNWLITSKPKSN
jgi:hypothetical protein